MKNIRVSPHKKTPLHYHTTHSSMNQDIEFENIGFLALHSIFQSDFELLIPTYTEMQGSYVFTS